MSQTVSAQSQQFASLRRSEADAPETIAQLRRNLAAVRDRRAGSAGTVAEMTKAYPDDSIAVIAGNLDGADAALGRADAALTAAEAGVTAKTSVTDQLAAAESGIHEATQLLDAIERQSQVFESQNAIEARQLVGCVIPIPGPCIDVLRLEQANLVVVAQQPARNLSNFRELTDFEHMRLSR